jgi:hypothetical protein
MLAANAALASQATPVFGAQKPASSNDPSFVCKYVVAAGRARDNKPYQVCQRQADWDAMATYQAKDANHVECHYQEILGSRLRVGKRCMTHDMWAEQQRLDQDYIEQIQAATRGPISH